MKVDYFETSGSEASDLLQTQNGLPVSLGAKGRAGYARPSNSDLRLSAAIDSKMLRRAMLSAMAGAAISASAGQITPPPLPPRLAQVKVMPGQSKEETKKMERAHRHHAKHEKKDYERDDSEDDDKGKDKNKPGKK